MLSCLAWKRKVSQEGLSNLPASMEVIALVHTGPLKVLGEQLPSGTEVIVMQVHKVSTTHI